MKESTDPARVRFLRLTEQLASGEATPSPHRDGFGTGSLFIGRKMFGLLDNAGKLVLKLPPARVEALIAQGTGGPWHPGAGKPLKEYVAIGMDHSAQWLRLARESRDYMGSKR